MSLKAPFPYFGGKSMVADIVWQYLGNPKVYIEPFFGSGAVLLARPIVDLTNYEIINDKDGFVCNAWRALKHAPDTVAEYCDYPCNHADIAARRKVLHEEALGLLDKLVNDDEYYDAKLAGYWIYGMSYWIGSRFITQKFTQSIGKRPHLTRNQGVGKILHLNRNRGVGQVLHLTGNQGIGQVPRLSHDDSIGKIPCLTRNQGVGQIPHLARNRGIWQMPQLPEQSMLNAPYNHGLYDWFRALQERLRYVKVVCGDWTRVCGGNWRDDGGRSVGMFFDPPYSVEDRADNIYAHDSKTVAHDVREWCIEHGNRETYCIVLAGYYEEHEELLSKGWRVHFWKANGGYAHQRKKGENKNCYREALFISPYCNKLTLLD
ncbi:MAG: DNA adenine methylase [Fervidobacterium sp.]|uniref:DNA adenine methylase n=1 Tax=Fervidobacterium sp. TaxID=1871331 RepID=UPI0025C7148A|nr:DNA adenine methylase [Fervidobacterium sp.]NPU90005.1 DNA adenine methylase [Fervidobacterium sp.]